MGAQADRRKEPPHGGQRQSGQRDVFHALADPTRRRLLQELAQGEQPLNALSGQFDVSRTAVSKHLRVLAEAGLVRERKAGRETRYRLDAEPLRELKEWVAFYERFWDNKLAALERYLEAEDSD
ncbi:ArsR/SmtB family transcription factor [Gorillibacterium timonense]|uniref:ArsR/SmtB family transcription factor n=1 Tax=Gorillibacterium timonense TaxID=1689269 RepID=UPI00071D1548|nr:metalloregulator ArsR/SmtB family transcription factor [Gorillibacterium timonense]